MCFEMEALPATGNASRDSWPDARFRMLTFRPTTAKVKETYLSLQRRKQTLVIVDNS
jgi:hypothetical protein